MTPPAHAGADLVSVTAFAVSRDDLPLGALLPWRRRPLVRPRYWRAGPHVLRESGRGLVEIVGRESLAGLDTACVPAWPYGGAILEMVPRVVGRWAEGGS